MKKLALASTALLAALAFAPTGADACSYGRGVHGVGFRHSGYGHRGGLHNVGFRHRRYGHRYGYRRGSHTVVAPVPGTTGRGRDLAISRGPTGASTIQTDSAAAGNAGQPSRRMPQGSGGGH